MAHPKYAAHDAREAQTKNHVPPDPAPPDPTTYARVDLMERDRLCAQLGQETAARIAAEKELEQVETERNKLADQVAQDTAENAELRVQIADLLREIATLTPDPRPAAPAWATIGKTFAEMCERMVDSSRLAGIEVETEDGERYLIGDVNPGGYREHGQAFRRDVVIIRARVRVQR